VGAVCGGVSAPQPGAWGERRELPQRSPGGAPAAISFFAYFRPQNASGSKKKTIVTTTFKSGGDKSPSSHTKLRLCRFPTQIPRKCSSSFYLGPDLQNILRLIVSLS